MQLVTKESSLAKPDCAWVWLREPKRKVHRTLANHRKLHIDTVEQDPSLTEGVETWQNCQGLGSFEYSKRVGNAYMEYATEARLGHVPTNEDYARIHNGGPNGFKKASTVEYILE